MLQGDPKRLGQVLSNLIGNAIKFTPDGGAISTTIDAQASHVEVSILDTGKGVPPAQHGALFERFMRADHKVAGTGLGLAIVREIVEAHGGTAGVENLPERGARFWFRIPRRATAVSNS